MCNTIAGQTGGMQQARAEPPRQLAIYRLRKHSLHFLPRRKHWPKNVIVSAKIIHMFPYIKVTGMAPKMLSEAVTAGMMFITSRQRKGKILYQKQYLCGR